MNASHFKGYEPSTQLLNIPFRELTLTDYKWHQHLQFQTGPPTSFLMVLKSSRLTDQIGTFGKLRLPSSLSTKDCYNMPKGQNPSPCQCLLSQMGSHPMDLTQCQGMAWPGACNEKEQLGQGESIGMMTVYTWLTWDEVRKKLLLPLPR